MERAYPPFPYNREIYHKLSELAQIADSFDQLTKIALLGDFLLDPTGHYHKGLYITIESICRKLRGLPTIGSEEKSPYPCKCWPDCAPTFEPPF